MGEYVHADMSTLRTQYKTRKLQSLKEHVAKADKRLMEQRRRVLAEQRAVFHFTRADGRIRAINEAKFDPQEAKSIAKTVKRLEGILGQMKSQNGELHNIGRIVGDLTKELSQYTGAGWWTKMLASMKDSRNPMTKAAALEGLLKGGMEAIEDILGTQGEQLRDDVAISDQGPLGQNIKNALAKAFDPGRISSLSALGGGKVSQLFGTKGSIGSVIAQDLANITPAQLRTLSGAIKGMQTVAPTEVTPQAAAAASQGGEGQQSQGGQQNGQKPQVPDLDVPQKPAKAKANVPDLEAPQNGAKQNQPNAAPAQAQDDVQLATPDSEPAQVAAAPQSPEQAPAAAKQSKKPPVAVSTDAIVDKAGMEMANVKGAIGKGDQKKALYYAAKALQKLGLDVDSAVNTLNPKPAHTAN